VAGALGVDHVLRGARNRALRAVPDDDVLRARLAGEDPAVLEAAARGRRGAAVEDVDVRVGEPPAAGFALAALAVERVRHEVVDLPPGDPAERVGRRAPAGPLDEGADGEAGDVALGRDRLARRPGVDHGGRRRGRDLDDDRRVPVAGGHVVRRRHARVRRVRRVLHVRHVARVDRLHRPAVGVGVGGVGGHARVGVHRGVLGAAGVHRRAEEATGARGVVGESAVRDALPAVDDRVCLLVDAVVEEVFDAVAVAVLPRAAVAGRRRVGRPRHARALVEVVEHAVAVAVARGGAAGDGGRERRHDDRCRAADAVGVGLDAVADRHAGAEVIAVEDPVAVEVASGAAGARGVGGPTRADRDALVRVVADPVAVLVAVAAGREGAAGDENEGEREELGERRLVHGLCLLRHVRDVARQRWPGCASQRAGVIPWERGQRSARTCVQAPLNSCGWGRKSSDCSRTQKRKALRS
jgi:hypothetical protein